MRTVSELDKEIQAAIEKVVELEAERNALDALSLEAQVAEVLHDKMCHGEHNSRCGWFYETPYTVWDYSVDTASTAHKTYLEKATKMLSIVDDKETLLALIELF